VGGAAGVTGASLLGVAATFDAGGGCFLASAGFFASARASLVLAFGSGAFFAVVFFAIFFSVCFLAMVVSFLWVIGWCHPGPGG